MPTLSERDKQEVLQLAFGPHTSMVCKKHMYNPGGPKAPTQGCSDCVWAMLFFHISQLPPNKMKERLEEMEAAIVLACEAEDVGMFDFKPYRHPRVEITKGDA